MRTPETPAELGLPHAQWWEGQRDTVERVLDAFDEYSYVLLSAPTGSGKTMIATAVQRLLGLDSVTLTHTISLQGQYIKTLPWAQVVTGRANHPCDLVQLKAIGASAAQAPCTQGDDCELLELGNWCSYYSQLYAAAGNPQAVLNYAYAVRIVQARGIRGMKGNPFHRDLLVCDEADLAEAAIIEAVTIRLDKAESRRFGRPALKATAVELAAWARGVMPQVQDWYSVQRKAVVCADHDKLTCIDCDHQPSSAAMGTHRHAAAFKNAVSDLASVGADWIVTPDDHVLLVRPLWGWTVAQRVLFFAFRRVLLMSATLGDPDVLAAKLALPKGEWTYIEVPSTFPPDNRPVLYAPVVRVNRQSDRHDFDRLADVIHHIAEQPAFRERKGIIHTASFAIAKRLFQRLVLLSDRYLPHLGGRDAKDQIIDRLRNDDRPLIALSPSLATGVDIPYEIGFQVVAKVPFGDLGDPVTRARREYEDFGQQNYDAEAMNTVVQACGRAVRAPDDVGVTFILDGNFWSLYRRTYTPAYFDVKQQMKGGRDG